MARGKRFSAEEDAKLLKLIEHNPGKRHIDIARMALDLGCIINRPEGSLADRISTMRKTTNKPAALPAVEIEEQMPIIINEDEGEENNSLRRVNLGLNKDLYDFVRIVSRASGQSMNNFINLIIKKYVDENAKLYATAFQLLNQISEVR